jgi:hypothetical protein
MKRHPSDPQGNPQFQRFREKQDGRAFKEQPWRSRATMRVWRAPDIEAALREKEGGDK